MIKGLTGIVLSSVLFSGALFGQGSITAVSNAALPGAPLAPGTLIDVTGQGLISPTTAQLADCHNNPQFCALVGGQPATVISSGSTKWRIQIPVLTAVGQSTVELGPTAPFPITLVQYAPTLFSEDQTGAGTVNAQGFSVSPVGALIQPGYQVDLTANPAKLGDVLVINATGLGPVDPDNFNETFDTPVVTIGGKPALVSFSYLVDSPSVCQGPFCTRGMYQVMATLPPALVLPGQPLPVVLTIGGVSSQTLTVPIGSLPIVKAVENAASGSTALFAPGSLASVYGTTFGTTDQTSGFPNTDFSGVSVTFNGIKAPLLFLGTAVRNAYGQINLQVPTELPESGPVTVKVTTAQGSSTDFTVQMASAAPGVFWFYSAADRSRRSAAVQIAGKAWLAMPDDLAFEYGITGNCRGGNVSASTFCAEPARPGDAIQIFVTGLGKSSPNGDPAQGALGTGIFAPASGSPLYTAVQQPTVTIGGTPTTVTFAGVPAGSFAGFYRIDLQIPANVQTGTDVPISVSMPNGNLDTQTTIAIHQ